MFGGERSVPVTASCSANPTEVMAGEPVRVTASGNNFNPKHTLKYDWSSTGGKLSGTDGSHIWSKVLGGNRDDTGTAVATDPLGNVAVAGSFASTATFGPATLTTYGLQAAFVAKYAADGTYVWAQALGGSGGTATATAVAMDAAGHVAVTGSFQGAVTDFAGAPLSTTGSDDIFVAKLSAPSGTALWSKHFGSSSSDLPYAIAADRLSGSVALTGYFQGSATFGSTSLQSAGQTDMFLVQLAP